MLYHSNCYQIFLIIYGWHGVNTIPVYCFYDQPETAETKIISANERIALKYFSSKKR